jgi:hypothetical protein
VPWLLSPRSLRNTPPPTEGSTRAGLASDI